MQKSTDYTELLQKAGISIDDMANTLSKRMGIGSPEQWRHTLMTGDARHFSKGDSETAMRLLKSNRDVLRQVGDVLRH